MRGELGRGNARRAHPLDEEPAAGPGAVGMAAFFVYAARGLIVVEDVAAQGVQAQSRAEALERPFGGFPDLPEFCPRYHSGQHPIAGQALGA